MIRVTLSFLAFLLVINPTKICFAALADQTLVDAYVRMALALDPEKLPRSGAVQCSFIEGSDFQETVFGAERQLAITGLALLCIRAGCAKLGMNIGTGMDKVMSLTDEELSELMRGQGFSAESIQRALTARRQQGRHQTQKIDCTNASPSARTFVFDSCFSTPMLCQ